MVSASYSWQEVCASALGESDPKKLISCVERAIAAIERRYADLGSNPGTPKELRAIRKAISALERHLTEKLIPHIAVDAPKPPVRISGAAPERPASEFDMHARRLLLCLRSTPLQGKPVVGKSK